jgi:hypothetical protein
MMAPPLAGSLRVQGHRDYVINTLLHGMTGPIAGQTFSGQVMLPMGTQSDQWIANIASYVRNSFGNTGSFITPEDVARVRASTSTRKTPWTQSELESTLPRLLPADPSWRATASHNAEKAANGLSLAAWTTVAPQEPGMWFQVELPEPTMVTEVQFDAGAPGGRGIGRGGQRGQLTPAAGRGPTAPGAGSSAAAPAGGAAGAAAPPANPAGRQGQPPGATAPGGRGNTPAAVFGSFPAGYRVQVSTDGKTWGAPVAEGKGSPATTVATFKPVRAKFIRVTQTDKPENALPWSVLNFRVYGAGR